MSYTTVQSYVIYHKMIKFIKSQGGAFEENELIEALENATAQSFCDFRMNTEENHFFDALQIPYQLLQTNQDLASRISARIFELVLQRCITLKEHKVLLSFNPNGLASRVILKSQNVRNLKKYLSTLHQACLKKAISDEQYRFALFGSDKDNFPIFHEASMYGDVDCLNEYLIALDDAFKEKLISKEQYSAAWLKTTKSGGFSSLHQVLLTKDFSKVQLYLNNLLMMVKQGVMTPIECRTLILCKNDALFTGMHSVLQAGNAESTKAFLDFIKEAIKVRVIDFNDYGNLLCSLNNEEFSPLHQALKSEDVNNLIAYIASVRVAVENDIIKPMAFKLLLIQPNKKQFTTLNHVLKAGSNVNFMCYLMLVNFAHEQGFIKNSEFTTLLTRATTDGFTPLHQAAASGNFELVQMVVRLLQKHLSHYVMNEALFSRTKNFSERENTVGFLPSCPEDAKHPDAAKINDFLNNLRNEYQHYYERSSNYQRPAYRRQGQQQAPTPASVVATQAHKNNRNKLF